MTGLARSDRANHRRSRGEVFLLIVSAGAVALSFPPGPLPFLAWVAFAPFIHVISTAPAKRALLLTIPYSFAIWYLSSWWFVIGLHNIAEIPWSGALLLSFIPAACGAVSYILFASLVQILRARGPLPPLMTASLFTLCVSLNPTPFPGHMGHTFFRDLPVLQFASIGGESLVLWGINLCAAFLAAAAHPVLHARNRAYSLFIAAAIPLAAYSAGSYMLDHHRRIGSSSPLLQVGLVQPNVPIDGATPPSENSNSYLEAPTTLTRQLLSATPPPQIVVWPEMPNGFSIVNQPRDYYAIKQLAAEIGTPLLLSAFMYESKHPGGPPEFYNVVHLVHDTPDTLVTYKKNILIPFGEYIPFLNTLPILRTIFSGVRNYTPGTAPLTLPLRIKMGEVTIGTPVCLEAISSEYVGSLMRHGASILINPVDDAYFGHSPGALVHLALASFRAVEYRVSLIRVTNSGISQVISPLGIPLLPWDPSLFKAAAWNVAVPLSTTPGRINPNSWAILLCCLLVIVPLTARLKRDSIPRSSPDPTSR